MSAFTEDHLVEQPAIALLRYNLGWAYGNCYNEWAAGESTLGRDAKRDVVLRDRLRAALEKLNPTVSADALTRAIEGLARDRSAISLVKGSYDIDKMLRNEMKLKIPGRKLAGQRTEVTR